MMIVSYLDEVKLNSLRFTNYSEAWGTLIFTGLMLLLFIGGGVILLLVADAMGSIFGLFFITIGGWIAYKYPRFEPILTISFADRIELGFLLQGSKSFGYDEIAGIHISFQKTRVAGTAIPLNTDMYINIVIRDGEVYRLRSNESELDKIKLLLLDKGLVEKMDETNIKKDMARLVLVPPSLIEAFLDD